MRATSSTPPSNSEQNSSSRAQTARPGLGPLIATSLLLLACSASPEAASALVRDPIVYGADDRVEYYESGSAVAQTRMRESMVALFPTTAFDSAGHLSTSVPSLSLELGLCPGEPFEEQPAAAFCSGMLVDEDLVLTAGHCVRLYTPSQLVVATGYYYASPDELATTPHDLRRVAAIVSEALDPVAVEPRLDYAFLRLDRPVTRPHRPTPVIAARAPLTAGDPLVALSAGGGIPMKVDLGARVLDPRDEARDYFIATSDTSGASSGGAVFDTGGVLRGILARGGTDFVSTPDGCKIAVHVDESQAAEQYTYVDRAIAALCAEHPDASSLCRPDCGDICEALEPLAVAYTPAGGGCSVSPARTPIRTGPLWGFVGLLFARGWRRVPAARKRARVRHSLG